jgi:stage II sporulation protein R
MKYSKKIIISIFFVTAALLISYVAEAYESICQINDKMIRLHVIANSDTFEDQQLKYKVRDEIIANFNKEFESVTKKEDSQAIILNEIDDIRSKAEETIKSEGYDYMVNVYYGNYKFPRKQYKEIVLPEGNYDALRVEIGRAEGQNWWCVLFPPLCFVDFGSTNSEESKFDIDTEKKLNEVLTKEEIEEIETERGLKEIKLKSKIFEFIDRGEVGNTGLSTSDEKRTYASSLSYFENGMTE